MIGLALALVLAGAAPASEGDGAFEARRFADWLFDQGDYYRAIGEYERVLFRSPGAANADDVELQIARAYARGGQADVAAERLRALVARPTSPSVRDAALFELGYARLRVSDWDRAAPALLRYARLGAPAGGPGPARARLLLGLALLHLDGRELDARSAFDDATQAADVDRELTEVARELTRAAVDVEGSPTKSAVVAGALSAVVPGLGHLYLGEPWIAAGALLWNGVFVWGAYDAFRARQPGLGTLLVAMESIWYGGAIFGAVTGAMRYNRDARLERVEEVDLRFRWLVDLAPMPSGVSLRVNGSF